MRKPNFGKPRGAALQVSLSRRLPKMRLPASSLTVSTSSRPRPKVGHPAGTTTKPRP